LIQIDGAKDGWSNSEFKGLQGAGVHDVVNFNTAQYETTLGRGNNNGWNIFSKFRGDVGSQNIRPDSLVNFSTSAWRQTSSSISPRRSAAWIYIGDNRNSSIGDIVINGSQLGNGRLLYLAGSPCGRYGRNITIQQCAS
jgi:hypothetical protein